MPYTRESVGVRAWDVLVMGAGIAGLRCALAAARAGLAVAVLSKTHAVRAPSVSTVDGVPAVFDDSAGGADSQWQHWMDALKGADWLADQDAAGVLCSQAPREVVALEHMGAPFARTPEGTLAQSLLPGHSGAARTCTAGARSGQALLHTLWQQCLAVGVEFLGEWMALDVVFSHEGAAAGLVALEIETGNVHVLRAAAVVLAAGGGGRVFGDAAAAAYEATGDALGMAACAGMALQDMEFWTFTPTAIVGRGVLLPEACLGEGGVLRNAGGDAFMAHYAPAFKELAPADVAARAAAHELAAGRGGVALHLAHLGAVIAQHLPAVREVARLCASVDVMRDPVPVQPAACGALGGIPANLYGQACVPVAGESAALAPVPGLYAVGGCACSGALGAGALGGHALLDALVFGSAAGAHIAANVHSGALPLLPADAPDMALERLERLEAPGGNDAETAPQLMDAIAAVMQECAGVLRTAACMEQGAHRLRAVRERVQALRLPDASRPFNLARVQALEVHNLIEVAQAALDAAAARTESRGVHTVLGEGGVPLPRDDAHWQRHSLWRRGDALAYVPVRPPQSGHAVPAHERHY